jgi:hypothetical protein
VPVKENISLEVGIDWRLGYGQQVFGYLEGTSSSNPSWIGRSGVYLEGLWKMRSQSRMPVYVSTEKRLTLRSSAVGLPSFMRTSGMTMDVLFGNMVSISLLLQQLIWAAGEIL